MTLFSLGESLFDASSDWVKLSEGKQGVERDACLGNDNKLVAVPASACPLPFPETGIFNDSRVYAWWGEEWFLACWKNIS